MLEFPRTLPSLNAIWTDLLGGGLLGYSVYLVVAARQMQRWPMVTGTLAESKIREIAPWEQSGTSDFVKQTHYEPVIASDYVVDGREYRGRRIALATNTASLT